MKYKIARAATSLTGSIDLSREQYEALKRAKRGLVGIVEIEAKFDLLLENYAEYERSLLELTLHQMLYRDLDWTSFQVAIQLVNRRLVNLLSAARLYRDQVRHDLATLYRKSSETAQAVKEERQRQYETKLGFRVMEELRNYVQHHNLPVHRMSYPTRTEQPEDPGTRLRFGIAPSVSTTQLEEDGRIEAAVLNELKSQGGYVLLTPLVREYMEGLARVHEVLRARTAADVDAWESALVTVEERAKATFEGPLIALSIFAEEDDGTCPELEHVFSDLWLRRRALARKNSLLERLSHRYVTGAVYEDDA